MSSDATACCSVERSTAPATRAQLTAVGRPARRGYARARALRTCMQRVAVSVLSIGGARTELLYGPTGLVQFTLRRSGVYVLEINSTCVRTIDTYSSTGTYRVL